MVQGASVPRPLLLTLALVFAAVTIAYSAVWMYAARSPAAQLGAVWEYSALTRSFRITTVGAGTEAERAGLQVGDRIVAANGQPFDGSSIDAVTWGQPGDVVSLTIERPGEPAPLTVDATLSPYEPPQSRVPFVFEVIDAYPVLFLVVGLGVLFLRLEDRNAWLLALMFGSFIAGGPLLLFEPAIPPALRGFAVSYKVTFQGVGGSLLYYFFAVFPTSSPIDRRLPWLKHVLLGLGVVISVPLGLWVLVAGGFQPLLVLQARLEQAGLSPVVFGLLLGPDVLGLASLLSNTLGATSADVRRKSRVIVFGTVAGLSPILLLLIAAFAAGRVYWTFPLWLWAPGVLAVFLVPLSFAYAVVRHRVLGVPQLLRLGLQYAFARRMLLSLVPLVAGLLILDVLLHADQPLKDVLRARGWVYGVLGGLALVAYAQRKRWLGALDRTFFRERYDAQRLLGEVVEEVRQAGSFEQVAPPAVARIEEALHAEFVAVLGLGPRETSYRDIASAPPGTAPVGLSANSKLITLLRVLGKPLDVSSSTSNWLSQQLPHEETGFLRRSRIEVLVPIASSPDRTEAVMVLGPKRSEEPYTAEDRSLLVTIASSLALLLERQVAAPSAAADAFTECPRCGTCYDTGVERCPQDGAGLNPVRFQRLLSDRYRLDRRLGQGGMGTIYETTDTALERRVAVKLIRNELVGSADAAARFRREARATAAFTHPNVVTVYDFGVAVDSRAFLVMELLSGTNLRDEITRHGRLPAARTVDIMRGVSAAVDAAHGQQLVHRDLKPENIFLAGSPTGETAKVLDFGIAKFVSSARAPEAETSAGVLVGTSQYMSPEQLRGGIVQPGWDVWALGVVAYEMLTARHPFAAATPEESHRAIVQGRFTPLDEYLPHASDLARAFFGRVFARDAAERPTSVRVFLADLEGALA